MDLIFFLKYVYIISPDGEKVSLSLTHTFIHAHYMTKLERIIGEVKGSPRLQALIEDLTDSRGLRFEQMSRRDLRKMIDLPDIIEVPESINYDLVAGSFDAIENPGLTKTVMQEMIKSRRRLGGTFEVFPEHFADRVNVDHVSEVMIKGRRSAGLPELIAFVRDSHNRALSRHKPLLACEVIKIGEVGYIFVAGYHRGKSTLYVIPNTASEWDAGSVFLQCRRIHP